MPRKKKEPKDMTTEELAKKVFPPKALEQLKKLANPEEPKPAKSSHKDSKA